MGNYNDSKILNLYIKSKENCIDWQIASMKIKDDKNFVEISVQQGSNISFFLVGNPIPHCGIIARNEFKLIDLKATFNSTMNFKYCVIHCVQQKSNNRAKIKLHFCNKEEIAKELICNVIGIKLNQVQSNNLYQSIEKQSIRPLCSFQSLVNQTVTLELDWQIPLQYTVEQAKQNFKQVTNCKRFLQTAQQYFDVQLDEQFYEIFGRLSKEALTKYDDSSTDIEEIKQWQNLSNKQMAMASCTIF